MEYERINKVQSGIISPSKLRLKLIGSPNKRKDGSKSNSARTSPNRFNDVEFVTNGLLDHENGGVFIGEGSSKASTLNRTSSNSEASSLKLSNSCKSNDSYSMQNNTLPKEFEDSSHGKIQQSSRGSHTIEEDNLDYDSNASSSSFEFHNNGQQRSNQNHTSRTVSRPISFKWNDAEKWIMNKQNGQYRPSKKNVSQSQVSRHPVAHSVRTAPPSSCYNPNSQVVFEEFPYAPPVIAPTSNTSNNKNDSIDLHSLNKDLKEVDQTCNQRHTTIPPCPFIRSVSMRDMGTEMTPIASQEPSRAATPVGATTPIRSPNSSIPSSPRQAARASTRSNATTEDETGQRKQSNQNKLSDQDLHLKTRKEIVALGVQLGKMNIAAWASKEEKENSAFPKETIEAEKRERIEFDNRAAAWEEAEKSKYAARYKREEIKIQAWESRRIAKLEAKLRRIEARAEKIKANAQEKMIKRTAITKHRSEEKRAVAEAHKNREAAKASTEVEYIRKTGQIPPTHFCKCSWLS